MWDEKFKIIIKMSTHKQKLARMQFMKSIEIGNSSGSYVNTFRYHKTNTEDHEDAKFYVFKQLIKKSFDVITEVKFTEGRGRADVLDLSRGIIFEIVKSETKLKQLEKQEKYPGQFALVFLNINNPDWKKNFQGWL